MQIAQVALKEKIFHDAEAETTQFFAKNNIKAAGKASWNVTPVQCYLGRVFIGQN